jgi:hypothetical protein
VGEAAGLGVGWVHDPGSGISDQSTYPQESGGDLRLDEDRGWHETNAIPATRSESSPGLLRCGNLQPAADKSALDVGMSRLRWAAAFRRLPSLQSTRTTLWSERPPMEPGTSTTVRDLQSTPFSSACRARSRERSKSGIPDISPSRTRFRGDVCVQDGFCILPVGSLCVHGSPWTDQQ